MATTWIDLVTYVRFRYEIFQQTEDTLRFHLPTSGERTQRVAVHHVRSDGADWVVIESGIAMAKDVDLGRLLELAGKSSIGGVVSVDGVVLFRHCASLADLSLDSFDGPFQLVANAADTLEHQLTGADRF
ncbi:MAG TPA: hypothetical protein VGH89_03060 [Pseudonocardia sp.]